MVYPIGIDYYKKFADLEDSQKRMQRVRNFFEGKYFTLKQFESDFWELLYKSENGKELLYIAGDTVYEFVEFPGTRTPDLFKFEDLMHQSEVKLPKLNHF